MSLAALGILLYQQLISRYATLTLDLTTRSNDLRLYRRAGEAVLRGELPYRDFFIEYPPGSLPAFIPPALFTSSQEGFAAFFASEMALALIAALVLIALAARRLDRAWLVPVATFTAAAVLLYPVAVGRYDGLVTLTLAVAVFAAAAGRPLVAYAFLGFGAAAKLVPALATLPLALRNLRSSGRSPGEKGLLGISAGYAVFFAVVGIFFVPAYLLGRERFVESFTYHADRGLQLESLGTSLLLKLGFIQSMRFEYGAWDVEGRGTSFLSSISLPVTGVLLAITAFVMYREHRTGRLGAASFSRYAAALVLAFMIGSKVLSPQYMLWLLPLLPLAAGGLWGVGVSGIFLVVCWTTTQIFPFHYGELMRAEPGAIDFLLIRNLLLVVLWSLMLSLPAEVSGRKRP